ncbi:MAG: cupredoxin domain-containing protein, partial [Nanoarchaeota archaeon]
MEIKNSILKISLIVIVLAVSMFFLIFGNTIGSSVSGAVVSNSIDQNVGGNLDIGSGDAQVVKIHVEGSQYVFEPSSVKKGIPVRLEADISKMPGCSKSIISSELGISKTFSSSDNTLIFTPNKAGTFYLSCSMNMYKGTITVLESDGSKSNYVQQALPSGSSCG